MVVNQVAVVVAAVGDSSPPLHTGSVCQRKYWCSCFFLVLC
jgi:hypothetical protein